MVLRTLAGLILGLALAGGNRTAVCAAEIVELKSGHLLQGDVLKEQSDALYVDIGIDVIRVPRDQIRERRQPDGAASDAAAETVTRESIYQTGRLPVMPF